MNADVPVAWTRLSPFALIYFIARHSKDLAQGLVYAIPALAVTFSVSDLLSNIWLIVGISILIAQVFISSVLSYWFFQYRVQDNHIEIRSGVFSKTHMNLPFWRVQNVQIERPWYYRFSSYSVLTIDSAGTSSNDVKLVAIRQTSAIALRDMISAARGQSATSDAKNNQHRNDEQSQQGADSNYTDTQDTSDKIPPDGAPPIVINTRSVSDLVLHGITNNRVWILLGALTPFLDNFSRFGSEWLARRGIEADLFFNNMALSWWQWTGLFVIVFTSVFAVILLFSVCGSVLFYYGFTLTRDDERYVRRSGLVSQQEVSIRRSRVQRALIRQGSLDILFNRANVLLEQGRESSRNDGPGHDSRLLVPSVTLPEATRLINDAFNRACPVNVAYRPISPDFLVHHWFIRLLPAFVLMGVWLYEETTIMSFFIFFALITLASGLVWLRFKRWGYAMDCEYLYIRNGLLGKTYSTIALFKLQQVEVQQSMLMRRKNLVHLKIVLASGTVKIPFVQQHDADEIISYGLYRCESEARSWM